MKSLLHILARMTKIPMGEFGEKCFEIINEVAKTEDNSIGDLKKIIK